MSRYSLAYKQKMIERLTGKHAVSARQLARETGLSSPVLSKWLRQAQSLPLMARATRKKFFTVEEKVRILSETSKLTGPELSSFLRQEGVILAELENWRLALAEDGEASRPTAMRITKLERELARKEKALAEAAALLVLKKKVEHLWEDADDDTDEGSEP